MCSFHMIYFSFLRRARMTKVDLCKAGSHLGTTLAGEGPGVGLYVKKSHISRLLK